MAGMTSADAPVAVAGTAATANPTAGATSLAVADAALYAGWFACLAEPTRVRLLHQVAGAPAGVTIGELAGSLGIGQPTVSHHVRKLADAGFVTLHKDRTSTIVSVNPACSAALPQAADAVMGLLAQRPCCPDDVPVDVAVRPMADGDRGAVRRMCGAESTHESDIAALTDDEFDSQWPPEHRWVAEIGGSVVGWAGLRPASGRGWRRGVADNAVCVAEDMRGRGAGKALLRTQVMAADQGGLWTLQTSVFPEERAAIGLHRSAGFRTVGVRERITQLDGQWRDQVLLERRAPA